MGRKKLFWFAGQAVFFIIGILFSTSSAQTVQVLDLSHPRIQDRIQASGFITSQPIPSWGTIVGTKNQISNLSSGEIVFIKLVPGKTVKPGDRFAVGQVKKEVFLPGAKKKMGDLVLVPGEILILESTDNIVAGKITKSYHPFFVGDFLLSPLPAPPASMPIRSFKEIEGIILLSPEDVGNITSKEIVFINKGTQDGVIPGDLFAIYQTGFFSQETLKSKEKLPMFKVGELVAVSVQEETSLALVTQSTQGIQIGDMVVSGR